MKHLTEIKKEIEDLEDVIGFLNGLKDFTINEEHPFGTCDYMAIDDMICKLKELLKEVQGEKELGEMK
jgi:hypothetical protein